MFTSLTKADDSPDQSEIGVSSLIDTWISLRNVERAGERNRALHVLKSRGMPHSNQVREFQLTGHGINLVNVSVSGGDVLVGSARFAQEAQHLADARKGKEELARLRRALETKRKTAIAQISSLQAETHADLEELSRKIAEESARIAAFASDREALIRKRMGQRSESAPDGVPSPNSKPRTSALRSKPTTPVRRGTNRRKSPLKT